MKKFQAYINRNQNRTMFDGVELPEIGNLFMVRKYTIIDNILVITYFNISKYAVILVPLKNNKMINLPNEQNPILIGVNEDGLNLDKCLLSALKVEEASSDDAYTAYKPINKDGTILKLIENFIFIISNEKSASITCKDNHRIY